MKKAYNIVYCTNGATTKAYVFYDNGTVESMDTVSAIRCQREAGLNSDHVFYKRTSQFLQELKTNKQKYFKPQVAKTVSKTTKAKVAKKNAKKNGKVKAAKVGAAALALAAIIGITACNGDTVKSIVTPTPTYSGNFDQINQNTPFFNTLRASQSQTQIEFFTNVSNVLDGYNITFANHYIEPDKNIKAALTWDEVVAMQLAYNDYTKEELAQIFNGADLNEEELLQAYRGSILQLMGAYVIEDSQFPVDMSPLIRTPEGKAFYARYHEMFMAAKVAREAGDEVAERAAVKAFYTAVRTDFPITKNINGIAHSDANNIPSYKCSVIPMISAAEIMYRNLGPEYTLTDEEVDLFNALGLCNLANKNISRAVTVSLSTTPNSAYADYEALKTLKIAELLGKGAYGVSDAERDLAKLDRFREMLKEGKGKGGGYWTYDSTTTYKTETTTTETDDRDEAVAAAGEEAVAEAEHQADQEVEQHNEEARRQAEEEADRVAQEQQAAADQETQQHEQEVAQDQQDLQQHIEDANETIDQGGTVNESDLGHGTNFDDQHSDSQGNLDDSVTAITTDPTGAVDASDPLPDPNELFANSGAYEYSYSSNEAAAEAIVESWASETDTADEDAKVYVME